MQTTSPFIKIARLPEAGSDARKTHHTFVATSLFPIEPENEPGLNEHLLRTKSVDERRRLVAETIANGCRRTLEVILANQIRTTADAEGGDQVSCRYVIARRLNLQPKDRLFPVASMEDVDGPGIPEVCRHCSVPRSARKDGGPIRNHLGKLDAEVLPQRDWAMRGSSESVGPAVAVDDKPAIPSEHEHEHVPDAGTTAPRVSQGGKLDDEGAGGGQVTEAGSNWKWPLMRDTKGDIIRDQVDGSRPTVSLLFSGGVFRGVFQVGVANALLELGLRPDVVAGSSVGTITAAMIASVFAQETSGKRREQMALLASTFLCVDRLVLTDRMADFVRRLTLRAGEAHFSLRDLDTCFRVYDRTGFRKFNKQARRVLAGLERLLYINPFALISFASAVHAGNQNEVWERFRLQVQRTLEGYGVDQQLLGTEPLELLISHLVLGGPEAETAKVDWFLKKGGIHFLGTATNIYRGGLELISSEAAEPERALLREALLASSAFPVVFRPRRLWEVFPNSSKDDLLVDGGVMDNLPLQAVADFLDAASRTGSIPRVPKAGPHLVFTASLEPWVGELDADHAAEIGSYWPGLRRRARRLKYNQKFHKFEDAQKHFRAIRSAATAFSSSGSEANWPLLDLEAVVVEPLWLCGTFAFHPMLGFRRRQQAASIAHGCASTLAKLSETGDTVGASARKAWGIADAVQKIRANGRPLRPARTKDGERHGHCWFRPGVQCPFSKQGLAQIENLDPVIKQELESIYRLCGKDETHRPR